MKKVLLIAALVALMASPAFAAITNSAHDFSATATGEICIFCHTPHGSQTITNAPLWNHATSAGGYTPYDNTTGTQDSTAATPNGVSLLCLSCHDNTVSIDAFGSATATGTAADKIATYDSNGTKTAGYANIGTDLSDDHPVGIDYTEALANGDTGLYATTAAVTGFSGATTVGDLLFGNNVECASCHDVHNNGNGPSSLLRADNASSALCLACHNK